MEQPRFNRFSIELPLTVVPGFVRDMFVDVMRDAGCLYAYNGEPLNCIRESLLGIGLPGTHVKLLEQTKRDNEGVSYVTTYWPKGNNAMRVIDDNSLGLRFRLVDGFINYAMLQMAVSYEADDFKQEQQGEQYKQIGDIAVEFHLSSNWKLRITYVGCVYESISNVEFKYTDKADEASFDVRLKFVDFKQAFYFKGVEINASEQYNHNTGN